MESGDEQAMETSESAIDWISSLPTEILHNILSFVPIRSVVRMRRLSRRWRQVCESLQLLCLNAQDFGNRRIEKFTRFVNNLLLLRAKVDLHTFQLHWCCSRSLNFNDVMMWIAYAVKHNVKVLDMELNGCDRNFLPHCVFTCPSLQELNLQLRGTYYGPYALPDTINLPSLRKLTLSDVEVSQVSLDKIIARSPGLEDLNLRNCATCFDLVESKVLKSLTLHGLEDGYDKFTVAAPHLIHFQCIGSPLQNISWREPPCLQSAHIESSGHTFDGQSDFTGIILHATKVKLLTGTELKVMLEKELPKCSVFENLEFLQIGDWCLIDSFHIILRFLQLSPRLQKLILTHSKLSKAGKIARKDAMLNNEMTFQCPHLQTVIIQCSKDDGEIDTVVNAMVDNGVSLEKIQVNFYEDIIKKCVDAVASNEQKQKKELGIFEKMLKENPEWPGYAGSESDSDDDDDEGSSDEDDDSDDASGDEDNDSESWDDDEDGDDDDDEVEDEDADSKMEDEHDDDKMEVEDDDNNMDEVGLGNNEHGDDL